MTLFLKYLISHEHADDVADKYRLHNGYASVISGPKYRKLNKNKNDPGVMTRYTFYPVKLA